MEELIIQSGQTTSFIEANTVPVDVTELKEHHIIPVFVKDNEPLVSHSEFVEVVFEKSNRLFDGEVIMPPQIRVSHPIKGRIPEAKSKPSHLLEEWEKTIYYERMMFIVEIPSMYEMIDGNRLNLTIGGVKSYSQDNLGGKKGSGEHFILFAGFQNKVCTNLCVWTDGLKANVIVNSPEQLFSEVTNFLEGFNHTRMITMFRDLPDRVLTSHQFATFIGRCKIYQYLTAAQQKKIPQFLFGGVQVGTVAKEYVSNGFINRDFVSLWEVYNLFTSANKSSYIDMFLNRSVNATGLINHLFEEPETSWYLN